MTEPLIRIASSDLSAAINPLGAELWTLEDSGGRSLMTDADPAFWTGHAPLLFPIVGALREDSYRLEDGRSFTLPKHGFARRKPFALVEQGEDHARFRLSPDAETRAAYPFEFRLDMGYRLDGSTLAMTATIANMGGEAMPFSFGFHPAFAWPLPYGGAKEDHRIIFEEDEPAPIRQLDLPTGLVLSEPRPTPVAGRTLTPTDALFEADALIWDRLESRSLSWGVPGRPHLRIDFPDTPWLGIWQKPGAAYLCIEPWAGMADPANFSGTIWEKPGIIALEPGASRAFRMDVTLVQG
jgi:galactose mutarotase-like enzyme